MFAEWLHNKIISETFHRIEDPQTKEEFLRDVIAILQGQPSPEFYPDQRVVNDEVKKLLSIIDGTPASKRVLLKKLEMEWQTAKALAVSRIK